MSKKSKDIEQVCRVCGCTNDDCRQCIKKQGYPCWWVEKDLCSACIEASNAEAITKLKVFNKEFKKALQDLSSANLEEEFQQHKSAKRKKTKHF